MLSLKLAIPKQTVPRMISIHDLPAELFDAIIEQCVSYAPTTSTLSSTSLVSKRFRLATLAVLFRCINITLAKAQRRHGETVLDFLLQNPHIRHHVQAVSFIAATGEKAKEDDEYQKLRKVLPLLTSLRSIELDYFGEATLELLTLIDSLQSKPRVSINEFTLEACSVSHCDDVLKALSSLSIRSLAFRGMPLELPTYIARFQEVTTVADVQSLMAACPNLESLSLLIQPRCPLPAKVSTFNSCEYNLNGDDAGYLPPLKTLELNGFVSLSEDDEEKGLSLLAAFQWASVERLSICNERIAKLLLPRFGDKMAHLRSFRISTSPSLATQSWSANEDGLLVVSAFLATRSFVELEIDGYAKDIPMRHIASVNLRKLRLHIWETDFVVAQANLRSAQDIQELAEFAPNLEHLMLDVARVGKMWHPTAIPGVDVDVQLYQIFNALSKFNHLKKIHLFPRYYGSNEEPGVPWGQRGFWQQAIEDDGQVVKIFKHLKAIQPSIEMLILSTDNMVARYTEFDPMSWKVCQLGDNILLRVQQANKDYEQRQIWHGERRLRTEIKRYSFSKPYLDGIGPRLSRRRLNK